METTQIIILVLCVLVVVTLLYQTSRSMRGFAAVSARAEKIVKSGVGASTNFETYRAKVGGDVVEYQTVKDLAKSGSLNSATLSESLAPYAASY